VSAGGVPIVVVVNELNSQPGGPPVFRPATISASRPQVDSPDEFAPALGQTGAGGVTRRCFGAPAGRIDRPAIKTERGGGNLAATPYAPFCRYGRAGLVAGHPATERGSSAVLERGSVLGRGKRCLPPA
jgi:hypothetical protein